MSPTRDLLLPAQSDTRGQARASQRATVIAIVVAMATTTMQLDSTLRDQLAHIAKQDFGGATLGEVVGHLVAEHRVNRIMARYAELRADPDEWADYQAESRLTDNVAGEGLPPAGNEYPEQNR